MMAKFLGIYGIFGERWTNFLGNSMILLDQCKIFLGTCAVFFRILSSRWIGWWQNFLGIYGIFRECWRTIFLGNSMILLDQCRIFLGICSIFKDLVK